MSVTSNPNKRISRLTVAAGTTSPPMVIPKWAGLVRVVPGSGGTMNVEVVEFPVEALIVVSQARQVPVDLTDSPNEITRSSGDWTAEGFGPSQVIESLPAFKYDLSDTQMAIDDLPYIRSVNNLTGRTIVSLSATVMELDGPAFTGTPETGFILQTITGRAVNPDAVSAFAAWGTGASGTVASEVLTPELTAVRGIAATADGLIELLEV